MKSTTHGTAPDSESTDCDARNARGNATFPEVLEQELHRYAQVPSEWGFYMMTTAIVCFQMAEELGQSEGFLYLLGEGAHPTIALSTLMSVSCEAE